MSINDSMYSLASKSSHKMIYTPRQLFSSGTNSMVVSIDKKITSSAVLFIFLSPV